MKTIIHLVLSDSERNDLARRIDRAVTKRLVTRCDIIDHVVRFIQYEIERGQEQEFEELIEEISQYDTRNEDYSDDVGGEVSPDVEIGSGSERLPARSDPDGERAPAEDEDDRSGSGTPDYLTSPSASGLTAACRHVLEHIKQAEGDDALINLGWCAGRLLQEGIE